ncbi:Na(+)/H(+) antiporter subunit B, partial [candidate division KSB1 bacterium]|nr:Na(+)/H(+) antiporter subunit B [candidate division KSB1 bacterium]
MKSLILRIAGRNLLPMFVFFSIIVLVRGHDAPGGGFIGGLLAAAGFILYAVAYDVQSARGKLH